MLWKLFLYFVGIFFSFLLNGYSVESITTSFGEQIFKFYAFMVLIPALFNAFLGKAISCFENKLKTIDSCNKIENQQIPRSFYFLCSIFQMSSMLCANGSLAFINYPTQLVLKSSKPIFILLFGIACLSKKIYNKKRVLSTFIIVFGVSTFMYHQYNIKNIQGKLKNLIMEEGSANINSYVFGVSLVLFSLFFDGLLALTQEKMRNEKAINAMEMMYHVNLYSSAILLAGVFIRNELFGFLHFFISKPTVVFHLIMLGLTSAFGQCFIYYTVTTFGPLTCSIITTIRKFFQILLSVILFVHYISFSMWVSVFVVFIGLGFDIWTQFLKTSEREVLQGDDP